MNAEAPWPVDERAILHVDMDAFFVSVELLRRPELVGRPVIVGGSGDRGVVAAASYEARAYGIGSAMASTRARRLCPHAVFLDGDHSHYGQVSVRLMAIFRRFTDAVEPLSLDEAFLDVTSARALHGSPSIIAERVREVVRRQEGLACSVGLASTKFVAKLASDDAKPTASVEGPRPGPGVRVVYPGEELAYLHPLSVRRLWGVGPATQERLARLGVITIGELAAVPVDGLVASLGAAQGRHLANLAAGLDDRDVKPDREVKSVGHEETFSHDKHGADELRVDVVRMADSVARRLRAAGRLGRTVTLKLRFHDFRTITRSATIDPTDSGPVISQEARRLLAAEVLASGVRLLGVSVSNLSDGSARQLTFDEVENSWTGANDAMDAIRGRFGDAAIGPATLLGSTGRSPGARPWGPDHQGDEDPGGATSSGSSR